MNIGSCGLSGLPNGKLSAAAHLDLCALLSPEDTRL